MAKTGSLRSSVWPKFHECIPRAVAPGIAWGYEDKCGYLVYHLDGQFTIKTPTGWRPWHMWCANNVAFQAFANVQWRLYRAIEKWVKKAIGCLLGRTCRNEFEKPRSTTNQEAQLRPSFLDGTPFQCSHFQTASTKTNTLKPLP
jgi:hypothetical protein